MTSSSSLAPDHTAGCRPRLVPDPDDAHLAVVRHVPAGRGSLATSSGMSDFSNTTLLTEQVYAGQAGVRSVETMERRAPCR